MLRTLLVLALTLLVVAPPAAGAAAATPAVCTDAAIQARLIARGKLTEEDVELGRSIAQVRCRDLNGDGVRDALFSVASGGTAGATNFGVLLGRADGSAGRLALYRSGYKVAVAVTRGDPEILQPVYGRDDPNCCPSSFVITRYRYVGKRFQVRSTKKARSAPKRFRA